LDIHEFAKNRTKQFLKLGNTRKTLNSNADLSLYSCFYDLDAYKQDSNMYINKYKYYKPIINDTSKIPNSWDIFKRGACIAMENL